jgi:uncharacterized protein (DUF1778 family)
MIEKVYTKPPMLFTSLRLPRGDFATIVDAARIEGISKSEFLRRSAVAHATRVIRRAASAVQATGNEKIS